MNRWMLAALIALPIGQAQAQNGRAPTGPVVVEVIGTGSVELRAISQRIAVGYDGRGRDMAAAEAARSRKEAEVLRLLTAEGVPGSAIGELAPADLSRLSLNTSLVDLDTTVEAQPAQQVSGGRSVQVATIAQVQTLTAKLKAIGANVGDPVASYGDVAGARRAARLAALQDARAGADRYAAALGLKVAGVRRVSEAGNGLMLPGLQEKLATMVATGGPGFMRTLAQPPRDSATVEEAIVAEFALQP